MGTDMRGRRFGHLQEVAMDSRFSTKLGFFAKRRIIDVIPGMPEGVFYGYVSTGITMPAHGACYVVQFDSGAAARARIIAYVDLFGQAYACEAPLDTAPKTEATMLLCGAPLQGEDADDYDATIDVVSASGDRRSVAEVKASQIDDIRCATFEYASVDSSFVSDFVVKTTADYIEFMATAYLAFVEFGHLDDFSSEQASSGFDLDAIYRRFSNSDLFDAIGHEVLEAESRWAEHPDEARGVERYLVHMLYESGLVAQSPDDFRLPDTSEGPNARLFRTTRYSDMFYIDFFYNVSGKCIEDGAFLTSEETRLFRQKLLRAESALNRFRLISLFLEKSSDASFDDPESIISEYDESYAELICMQAPDPSDPADIFGRWGMHLAISTSAESWRLPYRVAYEFCLNESCDAVAFDLSVPSKGVMAQTTWDSDANAYVAISERMGNEREARYAIHAALLAASCAFHASPEISTVCVNCFRDGVKTDAVVSVRFDRERFCIAYANEDGHNFSSPRDTLGVFDACFGLSDLGRLETIEPLFALGRGDFKASFEPTASFDCAPFNESARKLLGVDCSMRMNIFEDAQRRSYADGVVKALDNGLDAALAELKTIHDKSEDLLVRRICSQLMKDLGDRGESGTSFIEIKEAFLDAYGMRAGILRASALMKDNDPAAIGVLEELAALGDSLDGFQDSDRVCYRYFDGYESRALYSKHCVEDARGRLVLPLPDEVFLAHDSLVQELTSTIAGADEALLHAKRCIALAPSRAYSYLRAARVYFVKDDFKNEAKMCCEALRVSWSPNDTSLALYWLAFSFWKQGKYDAAVACYRRTLNMGSYMSAEAAAELEQLTESVKGLKNHSFEEEDEILAAEGVPVDAFFDNAKFLLSAAEACVDSSAVALGCVLSNTASRMTRDDAVASTTRALYVSMRKDDNG